MAVAVAVGMSGSGIVSGSGALSVNEDGLVSVVAMEQPVSNTAGNTPGKRSTTENNRWSHRNGSRVRSTPVSGIVLTGKLN